MNSNRYSQLQGKEFWKHHSLRISGLVLALVGVEFLYRATSILSGPELTAVNGFVHVALVGFGIAKVILLIWVLYKALYIRFAAAAEEPKE